MNSLGWLGGLLLAFCGCFEAYRAVRSKEYSISVPFVVTWFTGEILTLIPLIVQKNEMYLIMNYSMNIIFILIILGRLVIDRTKVKNCSVDHRIQCPECLKYLEEEM